MLNDLRLELQGLGKKHLHLPARRIGHRMDGIADDDPEPLLQLAGTAEPRHLPDNLAARLAERGLALGSSARCTRIRQHTAGVAACKSAWRRSCMRLQSNLDR